MTVLDFSKVARLPALEDNCAIAARRLEKSAELEFESDRLRLSSTVLEGHRFAVRRVPRGGFLYSWGKPFGTANRDLRPGDCVCNGGVLEELRMQRIAGSFPDTPNFDDLPLTAYLLDESRFQAASQVPASPHSASFEGYPRAGGRGAGTRNCIVLLATSSRTAGFVRPLAAELAASAAGAAGLDGVVSVAHTEGGGSSHPNNLELVLRALAGFMVHPNVAAILAIDEGMGAVNNQRLQSFMQQHRYPLDAVPHDFLSLRGGASEGLRAARRKVAQWLERLSGCSRQRIPASELKVALQCGGSDAFSGISGNPLAGWVARELIQHGGAANLAETDELIGAEGYVLAKVRDLPTARKFLQQIERFKALAARHGHSAEGNPSGGNRLRGLYNITLKSIGAATKKHPDVRLDRVIDYGERMASPGFYFMDSPGNDLESVGGQVASGANLIFFTTGNGSITNFPFVPTIKIVTTTTRYQLLPDEMDVNAGALLDGVSLEVLGRQTWELALVVASGRRTQGERAGHSQVSLWRDWRQSESSAAVAEPPTRLPGKPLETRLGVACPTGDWTVSVEARGKALASENAGLILPTSLCAGQVARLAAERLNRTGASRQPGISRYVALVHTEGCGASGGSSQEIFSAIMVGYLSHPMVRRALLLEHGCEKTHNAYMRDVMTQAGLAVDRFGFASIQLDGGIERALQRIEEWFRQSVTGRDPVRDTVSLGRLSLAIDSVGEITDELAEAAAETACLFLEKGGTVVLPEHARLLRRPPWNHLSARATLAFAQPPQKPGLHLMQSLSEDPTESLTGLAAAGTHIILVLNGGTLLPGHPLVPVVQVGEARGGMVDGLDLALQPPKEMWSRQILDRLAGAASDPSTCQALTNGNTGFQITRGPLGVSL